MNSEFLKTAILTGVAVVLAVLVFSLSPHSTTTQTVDTDEGQLFFPELKDPTSITSLEVRVFNESTTKTQNFKVEAKADGTWVIPSHHNYPADAKEELGKVVRSFMDLKKDRVIASAASQHERYGVVDPDEKETEQVGGRGRKIIFRDKNGKTSAQYIIGKKVEGLQGQHYVRVPNEKRIYAVKFEPYLSTQFGDWINADLLQIHAEDIEKVAINNYSVDESAFPQLKLIPREALSLTRHKNEKSANLPGELLLDGLGASEEMNKTNVDELTSTLANLKIVGVRNIKEVTSGMKIETNPDGQQMLKMASLQDFGYFMAQDRHIYCNEGEVQVLTKDQVVYTLRFGELTGGEGDALTAGVDPAEEAAALKHLDKAKADKRYLWLSAQYVGPAPEEGKPASAAQKKAEELQARFQTFFYVIEDTNVRKIRRKREDLTQKKQAATPAPGQPGEPGSQIPAVTPGHPDAPAAPVEQPVPAMPPAPPTEPAPTGAQPKVPPAPPPAP